jgi:hypothetical protein
MAIFGKTTVVPVTASSTTLYTATGAQNLTIENIGSTTVYVSTQSPVVAANAFGIPAGQQLTLTGTDVTVYGIQASLGTVQIGFATVAAID